MEEGSDGSVGWIVSTQCGQEAYGSMIKGCRFDFKVLDWRRWNCEFEGGIVFYN
ncbi:hypothetical protein B0G69_7740 [Paraburkholderia sp. RAU2J]|nr:hypothetical protein B0G69_7740 [Paraburkholderia sp. RAU2J]